MILRCIGLVGLTYNLTDLDVHGVLNHTASGIETNINDLVEIKLDTLMWATIGVFVIYTHYP